MEDKLLCAMAADLGVDRYSDESEVEYCNRVLYSALACWVKASALDRPVSSMQTDVMGVSRRHILDKCTSILSEMLKRHPKSILWFQMEAETDNPVTLLRSRLIRHGDLLNVGFDTNLILAGANRIPLSGTLECLIGKVLQIKTCYSGISMLHKPQEGVLFEAESIMDAVTWFLDYIKAAWWKKSEAIDDSIQYFNAYKKSRNNYSCWQFEQPESVNGLLLVRCVVNKNAYEYLLLRQGEYLQEHRIAPFLQGIGEHRRMMISMRCLAGNKVPAQMFRCSDHVHLKLPIHLPQRESALLESYAWPHNSIEDKLEWDMAEEIWKFIEPHLTGLGIKIME